MSTTPLPLPQQQPTPQAPSVASNVAPIAQAAQDAQRDKPGVTEAQMGKAPQQQGGGEKPTVKRAVLSVLGAAAGMGPMVQKINQQHNQQVQVQNQHVIDSVWGAHKAETEARNKVQQYQQIIQDVDQHWNEANNLPDDDPTKLQKQAYLAGVHQDVVKALKEQAQIIQSSQMSIQGLLADPKNRKIMSKAVGYDEKQANAPERQQMIAAIRKSVPGTSPEEAQLESQFPQGSSEGQKGLTPAVTDQVLKSATTQANLQAQAAGGGKQTTDTRQRADFKEWMKTHPEYTGTEEQWVREQQTTGGLKAKVDTPVNKDDRYIAIAQKFSEGKPLTPDEKAYKDAYDIWNNVRNVEPGVKRAAALAASRIIKVWDPNNPNGDVTFMPAGEAARKGALDPASIAFQTDKGITRFMTSGQGGQNIAIFNTASDHLGILSEAADALQNGNVQAFNSLANRWANATGEAAPNNFNAVKMAVAGELSKTFKGTGATDAEISQINGTLNQAQSPEQIAGAVRYYKKLMQSKIDALGAQYTAGKSGKPAFKPDSQKTGDAAVDKFLMTVK